MRFVATALATILLSAGPAASVLAAQNQGAAAPRKQAQKVLDPVCGMTIDPAKSAGKSNYKGQTYYFCSDHCKRTFDANPEAALKKAASRKK